MTLIIAPDGTARCLYAEEIDLSALGTLAIARASHVEPTGAGMWIADLSPSRGPALGPYATRSEALGAEAEWLETYRL